MPEHTAQGAWTSQRRQGGTTHIIGGAAGGMAGLFCENFKAVAGKFPSLFHRPVIPILNKTPKMKIL